MQTEIVTYRQWDAYATRIMKKNLKEQGRSLSAAGIQRRAYPFIIEEQSDRHILVVKKGWREAMRREEEEKEQAPLSPSS